LKHLPPKIFLRVFGEHLSEIPFRPSLKKVRDYVGRYFGNAGTVNNSNDNRTANSVKIFGGLAHFSKDTKGSDTSKSPEGHGDSAALRETTRRWFFQRIRRRPQAFRLSLRKPFGFAAES